MKMNIKDVQKSQNNNSIRSIRESNRTYSHNDSYYNFSNYVSSQDVKEVKPEDFAENNNKNPEQNFLQNQNQEVQGNPALVYVQSFQNLNNELFDMGINDFEENKFFNENPDKYQINLNDLELNDIKLFKGLTEKSDISVNSFNAENQTFNMVINGENLDVSYKSIEVSKTLFNAIENASKTGKSVRLDFGNDTSVILKISKEGKLSADFIPNDKAMETVLKNALPMLKAKFDEENIPYGELNYRNFNQQKDNQNKNNKEKNKDE